MHQNQLSKHFFMKAQLSQPRFWKQMLISKEGETQKHQKKEKKKKTSNQPYRQWYAHHQGEMWMGGGKRG